MPQHFSYEVSYPFATSFDMEPAAMRHALYLSGAAFMDDAAWQDDPAKPFAEAYLTSLYDHVDVHEHAASRDDEILRNAGLLPGIPTAETLRSVSSDMLEYYSLEAGGTDSQSEGAKRFKNAYVGIRMLLPTLEAKLRMVQSGAVDLEYTLGSWPADGTDPTNQ
jgi:hypothetical protein